MAGRGRPQGSVKYQDDDGKPIGVYVWRKLHCGFNKIGCDLHHIDGNKFNNVKSNFIGLCRNCHLCVHRNVIHLNEIEELD